MGEMIAPLASDLGPKMKRWPGPSFSEYEAGKKRRYELLFAVNGAAYTLAIWLAKASPATSAPTVPATAGGTGAGVSDRST